MSKKAARVSTPSRKANFKDIAPNSFNADEFNGFRRVTMRLRTLIEFDSTQILERIGKRRLTLVRQHIEATVSRIKRPRQAGDDMISISESKQDLTGHGFTLSNSRIDI